MKHAKLSASASDRWLVCPGSIGLSMGLPETTNEAAEYGTKAHAVVEAMLKGLPYECDDEEMLKDCMAFVDYVRNIEGELHSEVKLDYSWVTCVDKINGEEDSFGTSDVVIVSDGRLHIVDFKYGLGKVDVQNNSQLTLYALGAWKKFFDTKPKATLHIYQPRIDWISEWDVPDLEDSIPLIREKSLEAVQAIAHRGTNLKSGSHCLWCKAKGFCPELNKDVLTMFDETKEKITNEDVSKVLSMKKVILAWLDEVEAVGLSRAIDGETVPGYIIGKGREGNRKWRTEDLPLDDSEKFKTVVRSPSELEKIIPRKMNPEIWQELDQLIDREPAKQVLVPDPTSEKLKGN